jgi:hypothetical protein
MPGLILLQILTMYTLEVCFLQTNHSVCQNLNISMYLTVPPVLDTSWLVGVRWGFIQCIAAIGTTAKREITGQ